MVFLDPFDALLNLRLVLGDDFGEVLLCRQASSVLFQHGCLWDHLLDAVLGEFPFREGDQLRAGHGVQFDTLAPQEIDFLACRAVT